MYISVEFDRGLIIWKYKIVEEVHKNREQILVDANYDMKKVIEEIKRIEATHKNKLITQPFKRDIGIGV
jgi:hypothetical protein